MGALAVNLKFAREMSEFHSFLEEAVEFGDYAVPAARFWEAWSHYCDQNGIVGPARLTQTMLGRKLTGAGIIAGRKTDGSKIRVGAKLTARWDSVV
jgi:hypothetical protein